MAHRFGRCCGHLCLRLHPGNSPRWKLCRASTWPAHWRHRASRHRNRRCCPAA